LYKEQQHDTTGRRPLQNRRRMGSEFAAKLVVVITAVLLGISIILICAFVVIPNIISNSTKKIEQDFAEELFQKTVEEAPSPAETAELAQAAFEQPPIEPAASALRFPRDCFAGVLGENDDIVGRISMDALNINYLVTQATDNDYYLHMGYDRKKSSSGAIFLDYRCNIDLDSLKGHYILYGHNMKNGSMFHNLMQFKDELFFYSNRIIRFDTLYEDLNWEVFSAYVTDTAFYFIDTAFKDDADWLSFLHTIQDKSLFPTNAELSADDVVLTLCTCTYEFDDARFVIHARLVK
jgi:sortase B